MNKKLTDWALAAGVLSAFIALISLCVSLYQISQTLTAKQLSEWEQVVVFSIVDKAPPAGISFEEIQKSYRLASVAAVSLTIPKDAIQDDVLRLVLMELEKGNLISKSPTGLYIRRFELPEPKGIERFNTVLDGADEIVRLLSGGAQYSQPKLLSLLSRSHPEITQDDFQRILSGLRMQGIILSDPGGTIRSAMPFESVPPPTSKP